MFPDSVAQIQSNTTGHTVKSAIIAGLWHIIKPNANGVNCR